MRYMHVARMAKRKSAQNIGVGEWCVVVWGKAGGRGDVVGRGTIEGLILVRFGSSAGRN